ncbi:MAG: hypothetical protein ACRCWF_05550 [Beijerinckiaceae bacterium]
MIDIITASPSVGAFGVEPLSIAEIDGHSDRDRIWATIVLIRDALISDHEGQLEAAEENGREAGEEWSISEYRSGLRDAIEALGDAKNVLEGLL